MPDIGSLVRGASGWRIACHKAASARNLGPNSMTTRGATETVLSIAPLISPHQPKPEKRTLHSGFKVGSDKSSRTYNQGNASPTNPLAMRYAPHLCFGNTD